MAISLTSIRKNVGRMATRKILYPLIFDLASRKPIKENKVIFLELRLPGLSNSFQELYDELMRNYELDIHCHFFRIGFVTKDEQYKRFKDFIEDAATAKYLIYNEGSDIHACIRKRKGQHILNTWHAAGAFKKFGLSTADKIFGDSYEEAKRFPSHGDYDIVTVSSPEIVWAYVEAMDKSKKPECIKPLGLSRTDVFYREETIKKAYEHLYSIMPQAKGKKVISYAPTFRGKSSEAVTPDMLDIGKFYEELRDEYVLILKYHPIVHNRPQVPSQYSEFAVDYTDFLTIEELICVTDVMIADYSSTIFEYALFEKPMVFFSYDLYNYFDWRGFYYNYDELTPGPVCFTNKEVIDYIKHIDERFDKKAVHDFRERFMSSCDGHATERIMDAFFEPSLEKYRRKEPLSGNFYTYPDWIETFEKKKERHKKRLKLRKEARKFYDKYKDCAIDNNTIVLLADEFSGPEVLGTLANVLAVQGKFNIFDNLKFVPEDKENLKNSMEVLARARYIISAGEPYILRMIDVRPETALVQICPDILPVRPRWNNDPAIKAGIEQEDKREFPIHSRYDEIMATTNDDGCYVKNYELKEDGKVIHLGNVCTDILYNQDFVAKTKERFIKNNTIAEGKKIITILCTVRKGMEAQIEKLLRDMHEEFARDYLILLKADESNKPIIFPEYFQGFAISTKMSPSQCIAVSDIVIGDYGSDIFGAILADKEFYRWMPDADSYVASQKWNMDIIDIFPESICRTNEELIDKLLYSRNMDRAEIISNQKKLYAGFIKEYLTGCDGKASERLADYLRKEIDH